jgi:tape measure domain-containing protein
MADSKVNIILSAIDNATKTLKSISDNLEDVQKRMKPAADASKQFAIGLGAVGTALGAFGMSAIQSAANIETQRIGFKTLLGSIDAADEAIKMIQKDAASTPFEFSGLIEANKSLTLVTKNAQVSENVLLNVGKALAAAGKGQNELNSIIVNLQQIGNTGKISEMDIRQFGFAGVNILELLADYYGTTKEKAVEMVKESKNAFNDLSGAFEKAGTNGGRFANAYSDAAGSFNQAVSNLKDSWNIFLANEGEKLLNWGKQFVAMVTDIVNNQLPKWITMIEKLGGWFQQNQAAIYIVAGAIVGALIPAIISATIAFGAFLITLAPFIIGGAIIGGIIAGIVWIVQNWEMLKTKAMEIFGIIAGFFSGIWDTISQKVQAVWNNITGFFSSVWEGIKSVFSFALAFIAGLIISYFDLWGIDIVGAFTKISLFLSDTWELIKVVFDVALAYLTNAWNVFWTFLDSMFSPIWEGFKLKIQQGWEWITKVFNTATVPIKNAWSSLWTAVGDALKVAMEGIKDVVKGVFNWIIDKVNSVIAAINSVAQKGATGLGISVPSIPSIPRLANGGIINKPTLAMVGEAGPEAVVPLNKSKGFGGININITGTFLSEDVAEKVGDMIISKLKLQGAI